MNKIGWKKILEFSIIVYALTFIPLMICELSIDHSVLQKAGLMVMIMMYTPWTYALRPIIDEKEIYVIIWLLLSIPFFGWFMYELNKKSKYIIFKLFRYKSIWVICWFIFTWIFALIIVNTFDYHIDTF